MNHPNEYRFEFKDVSEITVVRILKKLKKNVSSGYDEIPASLIVDGAEEIARPLSFLLNNMFANSIFPEAKKIAKVIPIYKSDERKQITNYRPISILPVLSKVIERVIYEELYRYLEENRLRCSKQFGFRRGSSIQHAVLYLTDSIRLNMDKSNITGAVFPDLH